METNELVSFLTGFASSREFQAWLLVVGFSLVVGVIHALKDGKFTIAEFEGILGKMFDKKLAVAGVVVASGQSLDNIGLGADVVSWLGMALGSVRFLNSAKENLKALVKKAG